MTIDISTGRKRGQPETNWLEEEHAKALKLRLEDFWRDKPGGEHAMFWLVQDRFETAWRCAPWFVRSNLKNGMPPAAPTPQAQPEERIAA